MYIGKIPTVGNFQKCDAITESSTATYNLTVGSVAVFPETANNCIVSLNGVIQAPTDAYTISGSTIVFNSSLTSADVVDFILILGSVLNIGTVSDGTVSTAKVADDAITLAKMASGTDGNVISYDASGNPVAIATGSDGQVLTSTGAGSPPAFEAAAGGAWSLISTTTISSNTTNVDFETLSTDYKDFRIIGSGIKNATNSAHLYIRVKVASSFITSGTDYQTGTCGWDVANGSINTCGYGDDSIDFFRLDAGYNVGSAAIGNATGYASRFQFTIADVHDTTFWKYANWESCFTMSTPTAQNTDTQHNVGGGSYGSGTTAALSGLRFHFNTGDIAEGQFTLYGRAT